MESRELQSGTILCNGKYTIEKKIGEGGFGITYKALQSGLNRVVCIKEYFLDGKCVRNTVAKTVHLQGISEEAFEKYRQKFVEEAKILSGLKHPNIVEVLDIFDENNTSYMVMPFIEGTTLQNLVEGNGTLNYGLTVNYLGQVASAAGYIHSHNILHRDIKPDNIIITPDYRAILIDFGSAREFVNDKTQAHTSIFTKCYAPPEQYNTVSRKGYYSDIYSLGAVYYFAMTGKTPVEAATRHIETLLEPKALNSSITDDANRTILKAMAMQPKNRHQNIEEFLNDLMGRKPSKPIENDSVIVVKKSRKWLWIALVAILVAGTVLFVGLYHNHKQQELESLYNGQAKDFGIYICANANDTVWYFSNLEKFYQAGDVNKSIVEQLPYTQLFQYLYSGQLKDGFPHGEGVADYDDNTHYEGTFNKGFRHGKGKCIFTDGTVYIGDYVNNMAEGRGEMIYPDSGRYVGNWKNNLQNGYGRFIEKNGIEIRGRFKNGEMVEVR
jgi:serine/threonine protein kinase